MSTILTTEQEALIRRLVESGRYAPDPEALGIALTRLEDDERAFEEIRRKVREGINQADRSELIDAEEVFARLKPRRNK